MSEDKTKEELEQELRERNLIEKIQEFLKEERLVSDRKYAIKLIEGIVFTMVGLLLCGVLGAILKLVLIK